MPIYSIPLSSFVRKSFNTHNSRNCAYTNWSLIALKQRQEHWHLGLGNPLRYVETSFLRSNSLPRTEESIIHINHITIYTNKQWITLLLRKKIRICIAALKIKKASNTKLFKSYHHDATFPPKNQEQLAREKFTERGFAISKEER